MRKDYKQQRVSVIIPVKNGSQSIERAIQSVLKQTFSPYETLVIDGQSTDDTRQKVRAYRQVTYVQQQGQGLAEAFNQGIGMARGDFVAFLAHDDVWHEDKLRKQVQIFRCQPEVQYCISYFVYVTNGQILPKGFRKDLVRKKLLGRIMETLVARRTLFDRVGGFDPSLDIANDVDWYARCQDAGVPMAVSPDVLLYKTLRSDSLSRSSKQNTPELLTLLRRSVQRKKRIER